MQGLRHSDLPAILLLEDGTIFKGKSLGAQGTTYGEIAFNTGMYGYKRSLQIRVITNKCL